MSKRMMTKISTFSLGIILALTINVHFNTITFTTQADLLKSCMTVESNLPINHSNHPCNATYMPNKSWISWLSNDNKSAQLHFLDLVELLHYSFN